MSFKTLIGKTYWIIFSIVYSTRVTCTEKQKLCYRLNNYFWMSEQVKNYISGVMPTPKHCGTNTCGISA